MMDDRISAAYVGTVDIAQLHEFELARARLVGGRPLAPAQVVELGELIDELADQHGAEWPDILAADVDAQTTVDTADRELAGPLREVWGLLGAEAVAHAAAAVARLSTADAKLFLAGVVLAIRAGDTDVLSRMCQVQARPDNGIAGRVIAEVPY